jgi:hypothetical protein
VITGSSEQAIDKFKNEMKGQFQMSDLGLLSFYLGIEVHQEGGHITLSQAQYATLVVNIGGMEGCHLAQTLMEERLRLSRDSTASEVDSTEYRRLVGNLRYLLHTRLGLAFVVEFASHFMERPTKEHMKAVKCILCYNNGTLDYCLHYKKSTETTRLTSYSDSDHAGDIDNRKSTSGNLFYLGKCPVSWQSLKQRVVALSSCESEYVAATMAATQTVWLVRLPGELMGRKAECVELMMDSKSALELSKNPVFHERSKHIELRYHFIRGCIEKEFIDADYINTKDQLADILTKALGQVKF